MFFNCEEGNVCGFKNNYYSAPNKWYSAYSCMQIKINSLSYWFAIVNVNSFGAMSGFYFIGKISEKMKIKYYKNQVRIEN